MNRTVSRRIVLYYSLMCSVIGLFCACLWIYPPAHDDFSFMSGYGLSSFNPKPEIDLWTGFLDTLKVRYLYDNIRLGNFLASLTLLLPLWVPHVIESLSLSYTFVSLTRIAGLRPGQITGLTLLSFLFLIGMPWIGSIFSVMFAFNYIVSSAIFCFCIRYLIRGQGAKLTFGLLGLFMGAWHESFAVSLGAGIVVWCLYDRTEGLAQRLWMLAGLAAGTAILLSAPAMWFRMYHAPHEYINGLMRLMYMMGGVVGAVIVAVAALSAKWRGWMRRQPLVMLFIGSCSLLLMVPATNTERSAFPCALLGCAVITLFASKAYKNKTLGRGVRILCAIIWIFLLAHMTTLAAYGVKMHRLQYAILDYCKVRRPGKTCVIFADPEYHWENSWLTLRRPDYQFQYPPFGNMFGVEHYTHVRPLVVPTSLRNFSPERASVLESNIPAWITDRGYVVVKDGEYNPEEVATISYSHWQETSNIYRMPFYNDKGERWVYVAVYRTWMSAFMTDIKSIYFNE